MKGALKMRTGSSEGDGYSGHFGVLLSCTYFTGNVQSELSIDVYHSEGIVCL